MSKYIVSVLIIILFGATFLLFGKGESIKFNPKLNQPYRYEAQVLLNTDKNEDYPVGYVQMMMKIDYVITFINSDLDFYLEIEGIKGFLKPSLTRHSSESSRTKYFNTYDSVQYDKKQIAFKKLFQGKRFLISSDEGISMGDGSNDPGLDALREEGILEPLIRDFRSKNLNPFSNISMEKGSSFKVIDSVLVKNSKYLKMNNQFVVKDITRNKVQLSITGQARFKSQEHYSRSTDNLK
ncbi:hypothetical protein QYS49_28505 [Marivirga salinae]|uniref:Uncharacterized protein n=1 Tax=Marivirga salinarum TaxID=3059078 RepID=A0AA49JBJ9_9BACT|nr:hypothetical protein [Marivirga sp. BDSF4-3]WKK75433.2 hypothetical protein QYS49_28505 [Marivirga sp. BDSF4-3]